MGIKKSPLLGQVGKGAFVAEGSTFPLYLIAHAVNVDVRVGEERAVILVPRLTVHMEDVALEYIALVVVVFGFCLFAVRLEHLFGVILELARAVVEKYELFVICRSLAEGSAVVIACFIELADRI